jgi:Trk-type K+ transport system membrane component
MMLAKLFNPQVFSYTIMGLYTANILWQLYYQRWWDAGYWASALAITAVVTFGYQK